MTKLFFKPVVQEQRSLVWRPLIVLGVVLGIAGILQISMWLRAPKVPTATIPSVAWEDTADVATSATTDVATSQQPATSVATDVAPPPDPLIPPPTINLAVPFLSQAPLGIWDAVTEETCEEASLLMLQAYYAGQALPGADEMNTRLRAMVSEEEQAGLSVSISLEELQVFARATQGIALRIVENPTLDDLRALLTAGHPIIVPAYGRKLGNPFFTGEGPLYHMLVIRGYTETMFITNDPGTRHGENYQYAHQVLLDAIGDWDGDSPDAGVRVLVADRE